MSLIKTLRWFLSQAMLGVGRCSRAVNPSSPLDLARKLPSPGDCRPCTNYGRLASCRFCRSGFTRFLASPEVPVPMDLPDWGNRNDNVEPNGFTTRGRSARCRICPPIAVMIRCVAVHAWVICYSKVSRTGTWNWNKTPLLSTPCADVLCWFAYVDMNLLLFSAPDQKSQCQSMSLRLICLMYPFVGNATS